MVGRCINISSARKRASLSPAQRPRNGFCSTSGRRETSAVKAFRSGLGPKSGKGSDFNANPMSVRIHVRFGGPDTKRLDSTKSGNSVKYGVRQRLLEIVAPARGELLDLGAKEVIVPRAGRIVVLRHLDILEPDLHADQQALRRADFEVVETDIRLYGERLQQDA